MVSVTNIAISGGAQNSNQKFSSNIDSQYFDFKLQYNTIFQLWAISISTEDSVLVNGATLCAGIELTADVNTAQTGRFYFVGKEATLDNLGRANKLIWSKGALFEP